MTPKIDWAKEVQPLIKKYKDKKHPLNYENYYQFLVMIVLSAQDNDKKVNEIAPKFFEAFPNMQALANTTPEKLVPYINGVRYFDNKGKYLIAIAQKVKTNSNIPSTMTDLTALPGVGRKSANLMMREMKLKPEGVIVDLHVIRVANRLSIATGTDPKKIEPQIMKVVPEKDWGEIGMALSFLGREICWPTNPKCEICPMNKVCQYYEGIKK